MYKILTIFFVIVFYITRLPFVIIKDVILAIYSAFDISRFLDTYQNILSNFVCLSSVLKKTIKYDLDKIDENTESKENTAIGFKTCQTGLETVQSPAEAGIINDFEGD